MDSFQKLLCWLLPVLLLSVWTSAQTQTTPGYDVVSETFAFPHHPQTVSLKCGDIMNCSRTGGIFYKPKETVSSYERCSWIIAIPGATGYKIKILQLGFWPIGVAAADAKSQDEYEVVITEFNRGRPPTQFIPLSLGDQVTFENSSMVVVTFHTGQLSKLPLEGFILQYEAQFETPKVLVSPLSTHQLIDANNYFMKYPSKGMYYSYQNNELTSFLFVPPNNVYNPAKINKVIYGKEQLESTGCNDQLKVYKFNPYSKDRWSFAGRICGNVDSEMITSADLMLLVFESNHIYQYQGFRLSYATSI